MRHTFMSAFLIWISEIVKSVAVVAEIIWLAWSIPWKTHYVMAE